MSRMRGLKVLLHQILSHSNLAYAGTIQPDIRMLKLLQHLEGDGLFAAGETSLPVRYCLDLWQETIPLGSGRSGGMKRADGFIWSVESRFPSGKGQTLTLEDGRKLGIRLDAATSGRAKFFSLDEVLD